MLYMKVTDQSFVFQDLLTILRLNLFGTNNHVSYALVVHIYEKQYYRK